MEFKVTTLTVRERPYVDSLIHAYSHSGERSQVRDRSNDQVTVPFKTDEAAIEEVIDRRRQQQAVFTVQPLHI